jgi:Ca-activated chloride channel family protein
LEEIVAEIEKTEQGELTSQRFDEYDEQYLWWVVAAFVLLVLEELMLDRRNPRLRRINLWEKEQAN